MALSSSQLNKLIQTESSWKTFYQDYVNNEGTSDLAVRRYQRQLKEISVKDPESKTGYSRKSIFIIPYAEASLRLREDRAKALVCKETLDGLYEYKRSLDKRSR